MLNHVCDIVKSSDSCIGRGQERQQMGLRAYDLERSRGCDDWRSERIDGIDGQQQKKNS